MNHAVSNAQQAFREWKKMDPSQRGECLSRVADAIVENGKDLARLDCIDGGRPIMDCQEDIHAASGMLRFFSGMADKVTGDTLPVQNGKLCYTRREPYGVIAAITAWNYPLFNACAKVAPILAMGNSCVLKPAEEAPLTALLLAKIIQDCADIPSGLLNVVNGPGDVGELLVRHNGIKKVSFTGSTETGRKSFATAPIAT